MLKNNCPNSKEKKIEATSILKLADKKKLLQVQGIKTLIFFAVTVGGSLKIKPKNSLLKVK